LIKGHILIDSTITGITEKSAQRIHKHCMLAVVRPSQNFLPRRRPPSRWCRMAKI